MARPRRVLVITGAGISAESGIPTFRGAGGLWRTYDPQTLATHSAFERDPALVTEWYRERRLNVQRAQPNAAHIAVTRLLLSLPDALLITQNVDDLHLRATHQGLQLTSDRLVQIHGDLFVSRCEACGFSRREPSDDVGAVPVCPRCQGLLRPGVVWFGEYLDPVLLERIERYLDAGPCDVALVVGTTAQFGYIVDWIRRARGPATAVFEVNPEESAASAHVTHAIREPAALAVPRLVEEWLEREP